MILALFIGYKFLSKILAWVEVESTFISEWTKLPLFNVTITIICEGIGQTNYSLKYLMKWSLDISVTLLLLDFVRSVKSMHFIITLLKYQSLSMNFFYQIMFLLNCFFFWNCFILLLSWKLLLQLAMNYVSSNLIKLILRDLFYFLQVLKIIKIP